MQEKFHLDPGAIGQLRRLAQAGYDGYRLANRVIGKAVKAVNDDKPIWSHSKYVVTCVTNAWTDLRAERENNPDEVYVVQRLGLTDN